MANFIKTLIYKVLQVGGGKTASLQIEQKIKELNLGVQEYVRLGVAENRTQRHLENIRHNEEMGRIKSATLTKLANIHAEYQRQRSFVEAQLTEIKLKINAEKAGVDSPEEVQRIHDKYRPMRLSLLEQIECLRKARALQLEEAYKWQSEAREAEQKKYMETLAELQRQRSRYYGTELARYKENLVNEALKGDGNAV